MNQLIKNTTCLLLLSSSMIAFGQDKEQQRLEIQKARLQEEIIAKERLLRTNKEKEKSVLKEVEQQASKIKLQQKLINTTAKQTKALENSMYINQLNKNQLKKDLELLKEEYGKMIVNTYKSRSQENRAMFLLSSNNFTQALKRIQYLKQYSDYRKVQAEEIKNKTIALEGYIKTLSHQKEEKLQLISEKEKEKKSLIESKKEQQNILNKIKKDKKTIIAEIKKIQVASKEIDKRIDYLIRTAIADANKKSGNASNTSTFVLTPEAKKLASDFKANKGILPWPVAKGELTKKFGKQPHPLVPSITIESSGIEVSSERGEKARAVFTGEVSDVTMSPNGTATVMIRHGDFTSTYSNLSKVAVRKGDKVATKQNLGEIYFNENTGKAVLKFLLFQNTTKLNPQSWIMNF